MNTFLFASQIACYGVGIVSASLNIAAYVRRHRIKTRRVARRLPCGPQRDDRRI